MSLCRIISVALADLFGSCVGINAYSQILVSIKQRCVLLTPLINLFSCKRLEASDVQGIREQIFDHIKIFCALLCQKDDANTPLELIPVLFWYRNTSVSYLGLKFNRGHILSPPVTLRLHIRPLAESGQVLEPSNTPTSSRNLASSRMFSKSGSLFARSVLIARSGTIDSSKYFSAWSASPFSEYKQAM